jgi:hypothetical protein
LKRRIKRSWIADISLIQSDLTLESTRILKGEQAFKTPIAADHDFSRSKEVKVETFDARWAPLDKELAGKGNSRG